MSLKIEAHFDALQGTPDVLKACARHTVAILLGDDVDPMTPKMEACAASVELREWKEALKKDRSNEVDPMTTRELRRLANLIDKQWGERIAQLKKVEADPAAVPEARSKTLSIGTDAGLSSFARAMLGLHQLLPDTFCVILAAFILKEEEFLDRFTTSQVRRILESEKVSTTNPGSLISSLAQKDTAQLDLHGKSGPKQELLASLKPETLQRIREQLSKFKARSIA